MHPEEVEAKDLQTGLQKNCSYRCGERICVFLRTSKINLDIPESKSTKNEERSYPIFIFRAQVQSQCCGEHKSQVKVSLKYNECMNQVVFVMILLFKRMMVNYQNIVKH